MITLGLQNIKLYFDARDVFQNFLIENDQNTRGFLVSIPELEDKTGSKLYLYARVCDTGRVYESVGELQGDKYRIFVPNEAVSEDGYVDMQFRLQQGEQTISTKVILLQRLQYQR